MSILLQKRFGLVLAAWITFVVGSLSNFAQDSAPAKSATGVTIDYQLPTTGPLPQTYRVTLSIVDAKNPDWIISQFAAGVVRTVTAGNQGKFTETWDGLDDNFMPVPPGTYGVKGIYMPAKIWDVDGEYHTITPKFATGASSWLPAPDDAKKCEPFGGDPVGTPMTAIAVGANGMAVFYYGYLENGTNNPVFDLNKPIGFDQFVRAFPSGGASGGSCTATDGETIWSVVHEGGPQYVYRPDGKPWGTGKAHRNNVYIPDGLVTAMAAAHDSIANQSFVYIAQRGKMVPEEVWHGFTESDHEFVNKITVLAGADAKVLTELPLNRPQGLAVQKNVLYALHEKEGGGWEVSSVKLASGQPQGDFQPLFTVPANIKPFDIAVDGKGAIYLSDPAANHVYQLKADGTVTGKLGNLDAQKPGTYDPNTMMSPSKMAVWTDPQGEYHILVVEQDGPNRVGEWSPEGKLIREFQNYLTKANDGYAMDPDHPDEVYIAGQQDWIVRLHVDHDKRTWTVDAVWPYAPVPNNGFGFIHNPELAHLDHPKFIRIQGREYLACARNYVIYRHEGDQWLLSTGVLCQRVDNKLTYSVWHDANGNGRIDPEEIVPLDSPSGVFRYQGEQFLDDLSLVSTALGSRSVYRLAPSGFDVHGNPIFTQWDKLLTDPNFEARANGTADALHGGNEVIDNFNSDWAETDGSMADGFYVTARANGFSANFGSQDKVSRYVPDGQGGFKIKWRTGRESFGGLAQPGEIVGAIHLHIPINGILPIIDQTRAGVILYTTDGLYVDTLFPDGRKLSPRQVGLYSLPGEFFAGDIIPNKDNGKIYLLFGKYTPLLFEAEGWSTTENPVQPLDSVQKTVTINASQIGSPPEVALHFRGGAGKSKLAVFSPAIGGGVLDGSMAGWEDCAPVEFNADKNRGVEVRCLYDPEHLYLRWHVQLGTLFDPKPLAPLERIFTHDRLSDTVSFYIQGDPNAKAGSGEGHAGNGRPGDVRFVFGVFKDGDTVKPVLLGMYPNWSGGGGTPLTYGTAAGGDATYANVGPVPGVQLNYVMDADDKGYVLTAAIPRGAIPGLPSIGGDLRTMVDFEATFGGHDKFWWANRDGSANLETYDEPTEARFYPSAWAPVQFQGLNNGVLIRKWVICGPFGGPGAETLDNNPGGQGHFGDGSVERAHKLFDNNIYPPDDGKVDLNATFTGDAIHGWWPAQNEIRWKPTSIADLDNRVILGQGAQVWYAATWIHVPAGTQLDFHFLGHPMAFLRFFLNGQQVVDGDVSKKDFTSSQPDPTKPPLVTSIKTLTLRQGWNEVFMRGYCIGYPPFRAGLILKGPPEKLWTLQLSGTPPTTP